MMLLRGHEELCPCMVGKRAHELDVMQSPLWGPSPTRGASCLSHLFKDCRALTISEGTVTAWWVSGGSWRMLTSILMLVHTLDCVHLDPEFTESTRSHLTEAPFLHASLIIRPRM